MTHDYGVPNVPNPNLAQAQSALTAPLASEAPGTHPHLQPGMGQINTQTTQHPSETVPETRVEPLTQTQNQVQAAPPEENLPLRSTLQESPVPNNSPLETTNVPKLVANGDAVIAEAEQSPPKVAINPGNTHQGETPNESDQQIPMSQLTASQPATQSDPEEFTFHEGLSEPQQGATPNPPTETNEHDTNAQTASPGNQPKQHTPTKPMSEMDEDELMEEEDRLLDAKEKEKEKQSQNDDEPEIVSERIVFPLSLKASLMHDDIRYYQNNRNGNRDDDVQFVSFTPSPKKNTPDAVQRKPRGKYEKAKKRSKHRFYFSESEDEIVEVSEKKKSKSRKSKFARKRKEADEDWEPDVDADPSDESDDDADDEGIDSEVDADDYEEFSNDDSTPRTQRKKQKKCNRFLQKRIRRNGEYSDSENDGMRRRKKTKQNLSYLFNDDEDQGTINFRVRKRRVVHKRRPQQKQTSTYDNIHRRRYEEDRNEVTSESSSEEIDPLWKKRQDEVDAALEGNEAPFSDPIVCVICKASGNKALGTPANGWRDGYVQPKNNFSAAVLRGNYGKRMTEEFCLQHTSINQNQYIQEWKDLAVRIPCMLGPDDEEDEQRDGRSSESEPEQRPEPEQTTHRRRKNTTAQSRREAKALSDLDSDDEDYLPHNAIPRSQYHGSPPFGADADARYASDDGSSVSSPSDSESQPVHESDENVSYETDHEPPIGTGKKRQRKSTGSQYENDDFVVPSGDKETKPTTTGSVAGSAAGTTDSPVMSQEVENDPLWIARRKQVEKELHGEDAPFRNPIICVICKHEGVQPIGSRRQDWRNGFIQPARNFSSEVQRGNYGKYMRKPFCAHHTVDEQKAIGPVIAKLMANKKRRTNKYRTPTRLKQMQRLRTQRANDDMEGDEITVDYSKQGRTQTYNVDCVCPHCTHCKTARRRACARK